MRAVLWVGVFCTRAGCPRFGVYAVLWGGGGEVEGGHKAAYGVGVAGVFAPVFAEFAGGAVEWPGFGDFYGKQFYDYVEWFYARKIVGEVCAYAE